MQAPKACNPISEAGRTGKGLAYALVPYENLVRRVPTLSVADLFW